MNKEKLGLRFNNGKLKLNLIPATATRAMGNVLTFGALKYDDRNWEKGLPWSETIASLRRHLLAIEEGSDYDEESGLLHSEHILANAVFLNHFYHTFPEGDDRPKIWTHPKKIGLDIDGVLADFVGTLIERGILTERPVNWNFGDHYRWLSEIDKNPHDFWMGLAPIEKNLHFTFEPQCYITKRYKCEVSEIMEWLERYHFPTAPIEVIDYNDSKLALAQKYKLDYFVDDSYANFVELNNGGVTCFLMTASHNVKNDAGHLRIDSLQELSNKKYLF